MDTLRLMNSAASGSSYEEIEKLLSCPICLEVFTKPVVILPCQHNLCRNCANDVFQNRGTPMGSGGRFRCPTCRYEVVLDRHGVYGLQRNLLVENIIDMYQSDSRKPQFMKVEVLMCEEHEDEKVNIYCVTCQKPTCSLCKVFGQHQECTVSPMEKIYKEQKSEISDAIAMLVSGNDRLQAIITQTEELGKMTESNGRKIKTNLCEAFDKLYAVLEERKDDLMAKITADVQERSQVLQDMLKNYGQQLEGASKLMEASLALLEERSIPQFLTVSRDMIKQVLAAARSSEVRKPPFNIQDMEEFKVNFDSQEATLKQLDFNVTSDACLIHTRKENLDLSSNQTDEAENKRSIISNASDSEEDCEINADEDEGDTDDTAGTSITSRHELDMIGQSFSASSSRDSARNRQSTESSSIAAISGEQRRNVLDELSPIIKKGRWYDMFVRQLPAPLLANTTSNVINSSAETMVVDTPDCNSTNVNGLEIADKKTLLPDVDNYDSDEMDREIQNVLAPIRKRIALYPKNASPDESLNHTPIASPTIFPIRYSNRVQSPTLMHFLAHDMPSNIPSLNLRTNEEAVFGGSSPFSRHTKRCSKGELPTMVQLNSQLFQHGESPASELSIPTQHRFRSDRSCEKSLTQQQSVNEFQHDQPKKNGLYFKNRSRTWSHLLDKK